MGKHIATCGHEIEGGGINFSINEHDRMGRKCLNYSTYCASCVYEMLVKWDEDVWELKRTEIGKLKNLIKG